MTLTRYVPLALAAVLGGAMAGEAPAAERWTVEETSRIAFVASQDGQPVEGEFEAFTAEVVFDPDELGASRVDVEIDTASVDTGHGDRDQTLRSSQFFHVEQYPRARFVSDELVATGDRTYEAKGALTIRDVTEDVVLPFELAIGEHPDDPDRMLAQAKGEVTISRLAFGVGQGDWADTDQVGEDVIVRIEIDATRPR